MKITSVNNELIKETVKLQQRKYREQTGLFLLEGEKCIDEAIKSGVDIENIFVIEDGNSFEKYQTITVTEAVMSKISTTSSPPKYAAVAKQPKKDWSLKYKNIILLENIKDAGNLGTIIRSASAFEVDAILLYGDTVDLYNPKCVRSAVGNLWKVPVYNVNSIEELKNICQDCIPIATVPKKDGAVMLKNFVFPDKSLIMFGSEAEGLSYILKQFAYRNGKLITIEMSENVESLNLSISAGIILYNLFANKKRTL